MRIGIDIRPLLETYPSGVVLYTQELIKNLVQLDTENEYLLFYNSFQKNPRLLHELKAQFHGERVRIVAFSMPNKLLNSAQMFFRFPSIDRMIGGVDLFFAPNWGFISVSRQCRFVITVHDLATQLYPHFLSWKGKLWHKGIQAKQLWERADRIIAVSQYTKQDLVSTYHVPEKKISVIYSGADHLHITQEVVSSGRTLPEDGMQKKYKLPEHYVLMLGAEHPRKNFEAVWEAFQTLMQKEIIVRQYPNLRLVVIGRLPQHFKQHFPQLHCIGYVPEQDKYPLYRRAQVFIYPSYYEGFGFPPLEAALAGTASIVSSVSALPEVMREGVLYVLPHNVQQIQNALELILTNSEIKNTLIARGRRLAKNFTWRDTAQKTLEIFQYAHRH